MLVFKCIIFSFLAQFLCCEISPASISRIWTSSDYYAWLWARILRWVGPFLKLVTAKAQKIDLKFNEKRSRKQTSRSGVSCRSCYGCGLDFSTKLMVTKIDSSAVFGLSPKCHTPLNSSCSSSMLSGSRSADVHTEKENITFTHPGDPPSACMNTHLLIETLFWINMKKKMKKKYG